MDNLSSAASTPFSSDAALPAAVTMRKTVTTVQANPATDRQIARQTVRGGKARPSKFGTPKTEAQDLHVRNSKSPAQTKAPKSPTVARAPQKAQLETAARRSGYEVMLLTGRAAAFLAGRDTANDLSWTQWEALRFFGGVYDAVIPDPAVDGPARGAKTRRKDNPAAFARYMGLHVTNVTRATRALEKLGLMRMAPAPFENDVMRPGYVVEITKAGLDMLARDPLRMIGDEIDARFPLGEQDVYRAISLEILTTVRRYGFSLPSGNK